MVGLIAHWSNLGRPYNSLGNRIRSVAAAPRGASVVPEPPRVHAVRRRLGEETIGELVAGYVSGVPLRELGDQFGISRHTILKLVDEAGVPRRQARLSEDDCQRSLSLYQSGMSLQAVSEAIGCDPATIRNVLIRHGVERRNTHGR